MVFLGPADADPELFGEEKAWAIYAAHETEEVRQIVADILGALPWK
jgi:hypothetical protein